MYKEVNYYCDLCGKTIKIKSKNKHLQSLAHNEFEKSISVN